MDPGKRIHKLLHLRSEFVNLNNVCVSSLTGHGMVFQEGFAVPRDHLGRRLMAVAGDNETEKNCTEPGNSYIIMINAFSPFE